MYGTRSTLPGALVLILGLLLVMGCDLLGEEETSLALHVRTDKTRYRLGSDDTIRVTVRNVGERPVYFSTCLPIVAEVVGSTGVVDEVGFPVCRCLCPATLDPGETVVPALTSIRVEAFRRHADSLDQSEERAYRLRYAFYRDEQWEKLLPVAERRSTQFRLVIP